MTVPGVARHVPGTQPHTSGDLGGEGGGGERPTTVHTHERAHCSRGTRRRFALAGAQAIHALTPEITISREIARSPAGTTVPVNREDHNLAYLARSPAFTSRAISDPHRPRGDLARSTVCVN